MLKERNWRSVLRTQRINTIFGKQRVDIMLNYHQTKYAMHCHDSLKEESV